MGAEWQRKSKRWGRGFESAGGKLNISGSCQKESKTTKVTWEEFLLEKKERKKEREKIF